MRATRTIRAALRARPAPLQARSFTADRTPSQPHSHVPLSADPAFGSTLLDGFAPPRRPPSGFDPDRIASRRPHARTRAPCCVRALASLPTTQRCQRCGRARERKWKFASQGAEPAKAATGGGDPPSSSSCRLNSARLRSTRKRRRQQQGKSQHGRRQQQGQS